jgi:hypothetical protein
MLMKIMSKRASDREEGAVSNKQRRLDLVERKLKFQEDSLAESRNARIADKEEARLLREEERNERIRRDAHSLALQGHYNSQPTSDNDYQLIN